MLWSVAAAGGVGILLGLKYRIASVIAVSVGLAIVVALTATLQRWEPASALKIGFFSLLSLQLAYLIGLMLSALYHRPRPRKPQPHPAIHAALDADHSSVRGPR